MQVLSDYRYIVHTKTSVKHSFDKKNTEISYWVDIIIKMKVIIWGENESN